MNEKVTVEDIKSRIVKNDERLNFLPSILPNHFVEIESAIYQFMSHFCDKYEGGYWEMVELENGGFFLFPENGNYELYHDNYYDNYQFDAKLAGIVCCSFAMNYMANRYAEERLIKLYYALRDYVTFTSELDEHQKEAFFQITD